MMIVFGLLVLMLVGSRCVAEDKNVGNAEDDTDGVKSNGVSEDEDEDDDEGDHDHDEEAASVRNDTADSQCQCQCRQ